MIDVFGRLIGGAGETARSVDIILDRFVVAGDFNGEVSGDFVVE